MSLRIPDRFLRSGAKPRYVRAGTEALPAPTGETSTRWYNWLGNCGAWFWNRKELRRRRKLSSAISQCEAAKLAIEKQQDAASLRSIGSRADAVTAHKAGNKPLALRILRRQKRFEQRVQRLQTQHDGMDRKIMVLNELLTNSDISAVIKNVAGAMDGLDVDQQVSDLDDADDLMSDSLDSAFALSQRLDDSALLSAPDFDDEALYAELEDLLLSSSSDPPPSPGASAGLLPAFPTVPTSTVGVDDIPLGLGSFGSEKGLEGAL